MAVEIKELVIRAIVVPEEAQAASPAADLEAAAKQDELIQECVSQVLKIIRKSKER
jgi:hypothetical protein